MKKLIFFLFVCFLPTVLQAQWQWARTNNYADNSRIYDIAVDNKGNIYATGVFSNKLVIGTDTFISAGKSDIFLMKFDASGQEIWAKRAGGKNDDLGIDVAVDKLGNIYLGSTFLDTADYDGQIFNSKGGSDINLSKFDANGNLIWSKSWGSVYDDRGSRIYIDKDDQLYLTGMFASYGGSPAPYTTIDFGPGAIASYGTADIYIVKLDNNGQAKWSKHVGGKSFDEVANIVLDSNKNIFIAGVTDGKMIFDTDTLVNQEAYIAKFDSNATPLWQKGVIGNDLLNPVFITDINIDKTGNAFLLGFSNQPQFITFMATIPYILGAGDNSFFSRYDSDGNFLLARNLGNYCDDAAYNIVTDDDAIFISGGFRTKGTYGKDTLTSYGGTDIFVNKYDKNGKCIWAINAGGKNNETSYTMARNALGDFFVGGYVSSSPAHFGAYDVNSTNGADMIIAKLSSTTGIPQQANPANTVTIYPNPTSQEFSVSNPQGSYTGLKLYDATGRLVLSQPLNKENTVIDIKKLNIGVYYLRLAAGSENIPPFNTKLLVQH